MGHKHLHQRRKDELRRIKEDEQAMRDAMKEKKERSEKDGRNGSSKVRSK